MQNELKTEELKTSVNLTEGIQNGEITRKEAFETFKNKEAADWLEGMPHRIRYNRKIFIHNTVCLLGTSISVAFIFRMLALRGIIAPNVVFILFFCVLIAPVYGIMLYNRLSLRHIDTFTATHFAGVKAVGPLLEALNLPQTTCQEKEIRTALILLLPQMNASDMMLLNDEQRYYLNKPLDRFNRNDPLLKEDPDYCIAILKALEQVGDTSAIPYVERLANMETNYQNRQKIKQAAIECLPLLQANCGNVEANKTLLRASQAEPAGADTLLRPASGGNETAPNELLRASGAASKSE